MTAKAEEDRDNGDDDDEENVKQNGDSEGGKNIKSAVGEKEEVDEKYDEEGLDDDCSFEDEIKEEDGEIPPNLSLDMTMIIHLYSSVLLTSVENETKSFV